MIQDIPDDDWMLRDDIQWAFEAVSRLGLRFEALGMPRHIDNFLTIFKRYPDMKVVIDHCMKPQIAEHSKAGFASWADGMTRLADQEFGILQIFRPDHRGRQRLVSRGSSSLCRSCNRGIRRRSDVGFGLAGLQAGRRIYGMARRRAGTDGDRSDSDRAAIYGQTANRFYDLGL